ncbi:DNA-dependent metalloprotease WSS1-like isoform X2 [Prosopis cineraria]|nr:DNA-dependent metalloprotease WSS1-like isoform X2 [Prosopis cineraria]XP_054779620.1 DNA-dependent metalloprotease WSS1-like isoform X2 [Prosopis cineraria]XP_054779621.1 DNA-dependent metalloprotease WSS1-like isoform X2 [Prosopis cineraria]XP_054779622.1 DNA-dependent metalloprotease WSS1-like isoform X2 [Prosopis cineraria]XP_054789451.1 DNA-dependent metalloprotease WSS1-like isoform X2 [Prosopis cineraria]XP_054789452.1 DNA-dependent metalloprotease WSS1-like isoform X2 [Prosopis cine
MDLNDLNKVWEIKPLKRIGEDEARRILEKIAKQVQPIMRKRKWKVKILSEFCPANPSLQGLNIGLGAEVKLRLRRPDREWDFFPYEQIVDTMLHELCHNEHGPHNAQFYNLLDEIRKECEDLMAKGISGTGQGFDLPGRRLGGFSRQPPLPSVRQAALAAAESRAHRGVLLPSGPQRLGGDNSIKSALSPIQAAAMAAERRLHDDIWCGSKSADGETHVHENMSLIGPSGRHRMSLNSDDSSIQSNVGGETVDGGAEWQCNTCTLLNEPIALMCEACGAQRLVKSKMWSCKFCTLENRVEIDRCLACGEWRYSSGPPVSIRGPYVGT